MQVQTQVVDKGTGKEKEKSNEREREREGKREKEGESKSKKEKSGGFSWRKFGAVTEINGARQCRPESRIQKIISCFSKYLSENFTLKCLFFGSFVLKIISFKMIVFLCYERLWINALDSANFGCRQVLSRGGYDVRGFIVLLGCVSTSAWLMALAEKSCHLNREKERENTHTHIHSHTHTHICECVSEWERERQKEKRTLINAEIPPQRNIHPTPQFSFCLSLHFYPSLFFFFTLSSFLLRKVIRGLMESPNRSFSRFSPGKNLNFFLGWCLRS